MQKPALILPRDFQRRLQKLSFGEKENPGRSSASANLFESSVSKMPCGIVQVNNKGSGNIN